MDGIGVDPDRLSPLTYDVLHDLERPTHRRRLVHGFSSPVIDKKVAELVERGAVVFTRQDRHTSAGHYDLTKNGHQLLLRHRLWIKRIGTPSVPQRMPDFLQASGDEPGMSYGKIRRAKRRARRTG